MCMSSLFFLSTAVLGHYGEVLFGQLVTSYASVMARNIGAICQCSNCMSLQYLFGLLHALLLLVYAL